MRLLFILRFGGEAIEGPPPVPGAVRVVSSQKRLQKMDFWVRNPDHLSHTLLDLYETSGDKRWLDHARSILGSDEPEVRRDAMAKYLYGAFEPLDTGLAPLVSYGLARTLRHPETRRQRFFLLAKGEAVAGRMLDDLGEAAWYAARATLVGEVCRGRSGEELARMQYQHPDYAAAPNGETIASIAGQVRTRLDELENAHG